MVLRYGVAHGLSYPANSHHQIWFSAEVAGSIRGEPPPPFLLVTEFLLMAASPLISSALSPTPSPAGPQRQPCNHAGTSAERQLLFNRIAPVYDRLNDVLTLGQHRVWKKMTVSWSGAKKGDRVLDLCCGSGDLTFLMSQAVGPQGQVIGLDFSRDQLSVASARQFLLWKRCYENIVWTEGDALNLGFSDCYFDSVTVGFGLRNVLDKANAMKEILRVLKPGSRASILDFNKSTNQTVTSFQTWMIDTLVVPSAGMYGLREEYMYLKRSIAEFLTGKELENLAKEVGFSSARHYEIAGGLMGNLVANK